MANTPLEVQMLIIEWVYRLSQSKTVDYATLCACAMVCRAWTYTAQRLLFRRVPRARTNTNTPRSIPLLIRTLRTTPRLSAAVHSIVLNFRSNKSTSAFSDDVALLELCPQVQGIWITDRTDSKEVYPALEARLRALQLNPVFLHSYGQPSFIALLLRTWPNLRALDVDGCNIDQLTPISGTKALHALTIFELDSLAWLLSPQNDFAALRDLELINLLWYDAAWKELHISGVLPQLRTLRVEGSFPPQQFLERLERLESLVFTDLPTEDAAFPPSLRHAGYHGRDTSQTDGMDRTVAALGTLANLQLVTTTRRAPKVQIKALESVCRDRGVELEIRQRPEDFPCPRWDVDWI
ncbi:hypothetical protein FA95DRAFT_1002214 [Auriscalpium vulgare]|uniref:Uncharacterized protein n=1 Tax=Auriscalpium vulgare TaxID=40419 RepID=A0ACB8R686_9AGAM|nr:hypothetical protein FA95DRAFT_1002214 [Auriscalpium vulgare]